MVLLHICDFRGGGDGWRLCVFFACLDAGLASSGLDMHVFCDLRFAI